jgi:hypothetical protein
VTWMLMQGIFSFSCGARTLWGFLDWYDLTSVLVMQTSMIALVPSTQNPWMRRSPSSLVILLCHRIMRPLVLYLRACSVFTIWRKVSWRPGIMQQESAPKLLRIEYGGAIDSGRHYVDPLTYLFSFLLNCPTSVTVPFSEDRVQGCFIQLSSQRDLSSAITARLCQIGDLQSWRGCPI